MRPKALCSIELLPLTTEPGNRLAAPVVPRRKGVPAVPRPLPFLAPLMVLLFSFGVAACGSDEPSPSSNDNNAKATSTPAAKKIRVGLVTDIGGLNDRSFNQLANDGLERAKSELGIEGR